MREIRREGEEEQEVHGQHCQGAASQAQTKEPNQRKWEAEKGKQQDSCWVSLAGTSFLLFSVSVLNLEKNVTLKKKRTRKYAHFCVFMHSFGGVLASCPTPPNTFLQRMGRPRKLGCPLFCPCGISQEGRSGRFGSSLVACTGRG